jgi:phage baseplate assembly protein W
MNGMDRNTGVMIGSTAHLMQRLQSLLTTPLGSRVMRRNYGSRLPRLVDRPMNASLKRDVVHAVVDAIGQWETEFVVDQVRVSVGEANQLLIDLYGHDVIGGKAITLQGLVV